MDLNPILNLFSQNTERDTVQEITHRGYTHKTENKVMNCHHAPGAILLWTISTGTMFVALFTLFLKLQIGNFVRTISSMLLAKKLLYGSTRHFTASIVFSTTQVILMVLSPLLELKPGLLQLHGFLLKTGGHTWLMVKLPGTSKLTKVTLHLLLFMALATWFPKTRGHKRITLSPAG
jgi:hypothetical protein